MHYRSQVSPSSQRHSSQALDATPSQPALTYSLLGLPLVVAGLLFLSSFF